MTRLVDRFLTAPVLRPAEWPGTPEEHRDLIASIRNDLLTGSDDTGGFPAPTVAIDNVADYVWADPSHGWEITDYPNAAPPWALAWYEYRVPPVARIMSLGAKEMGYWVAAFHRDGGGWELRAFLFGLPPGGQQVEGPKMVHSVEVSEDGSIESYRPLGLFGIPTEEGAYRTLVFLPPVLMANSFAHCRNVRDEVITPPPRLSKAFRKRHGSDLMKYHVLVIDPMREVLRREGRSDKVGAIRALHICRGHFKTFDERPLFGRLTGTYWWSPQVRGKAEAGRVVTTYRVKATDDGGVAAEASERSESRRPSYPNAAQARAVEAFSVDRALDYLRTRYPGTEVEVMPHSNPGYDVRIGPSEDPARYVEVKGTTTDQPAFFLTENERQFSARHSDRYSLVLLANIDLDSGTFDLHVHDGAIDDQFALAPVQWHGRFPQRGGDFTRLLE